MLDELELHFVETLDEAHAFFRWLGESRPVLAIDTETGGLEWWRQPTRLVQFGDARQAWSISVRDWRGIIAKALREYDGPIVFHNAKFDMHFLMSNGLPVPPWHRIHDTVVMDHLIDPLRGHALKSIADRLYPGASSGQGMLRAAMHKHGWDWATIPEDFPIYWQYAALDTALTAMVAGHLWEQVNADPLLRQAYDREMAAMGVLFRAERRGLRVDTGYTATLRRDWLAEMDGLRADLAQAGVENPNANRQIEAALLVEEPDWEPSEYTPSGQVKLDDKVLKSLGSDIANSVIRYRRLRKWTSTYLETFLAEKDDEDRLHATIRTMQAKTGRMSITGPPLQTLPKGSDIRDCIIPSDGCHLLAVDYDSQEFRVFAHYANETAMQDAIRQGLDPHQFAAQMVYEDPSITKDDPRREKTKHTQYTAMYGGGAGVIAERASISEAEAAEFKSRWLKTFPSVDQFFRMVEAIGRRRLADEGKAYVRTWGGRLMLAPADGLYKLVNGLIQGSCADVLKQKIVDLDAAGYGDFILLPVHDELLFDIPTADWDELVPPIAHAMTAYDEFAVPLTVEPSKPLTRWGDKYRKDYTDPRLKEAA